MYFQKFNFWAIIWTLPRTCHELTTSLHHCYLKCSGWYTHGLMVWNQKSTALCCVPELSKFEGKDKDGLLSSFDFWTTKTSSQAKIFKFLFLNYVAQDSFVGAQWFGAEWILVELTKKLRHSFHVQSKELLTRTKFLQLGVSVWFWCLGFMAQNYTVKLTTQVF